MEVITGPARRATEGACPLRIEAALVEQLLADSEGADTLPLLSLTLARLYEEYGSDGRPHPRRVRSDGRGCKTSFRPRSTASCPAMMRKA